LLQLVKPALPWGFIVPPPHKLRPVAETAAGEVIVLDLHDQLRLERNPVARSVRCPSAGAPRRAAGKAGRLPQGLEFSGQAFPIGILDG